MSEHEARAALAALNERDRRRKRNRWFWFGASLAVMAIYKLIWR